MTEGRKVQELGSYSKARVRSDRFRGSLSVALIIISLRERETLIGMAYPTTLFLWGRGKATHSRWQSNPEIDISPILN